MLIWAAGCGSTIAHNVNKQNVVNISQPALTPEIPKPVEVQTEPVVTDRVLIKTSMGNVAIALYGDAAPKTVANFLAYVDKGFYSDKIFHRVIPGFMIQGGGFDRELVKGETDPSIELEIIPGLKHMPGTVSMARTQVTNSATAQFFICVAAAPQLNGSYSAFGKVEEGLDVVGDISLVATGTHETDTSTMNDVPVEPVLITSVQRITSDK